MTDNLPNAPVVKIVNEIHAIERRNIFDIGRKLAELREVVPHGEWGKLIEAEFAWSDTTASRYIAVARLAATFPILGKMKLPKVALYELAEEDERYLPATVDAMAKIATHRRPTTQEIDDAFKLGFARVEYGDYSDATLLAMYELPRAYPRAAEAIEALKAANPKTKVEADKIVNDIMDVADEGDDAPPPPPLNDDDLDNDEPPPSDDDDEWDDGHTPPARPPIDLTPPPPTLTDPELINAIRVLLRHAQRARPQVVSGITGTEIMEVRGFLDELHGLMHGGNKAKLAADRAEASAARQRRTA